MKIDMSARTQENVAKVMHQSRANMAAQRRQDRRYRDEREYIDGETECLARNLCNQNTVADAVDTLETSARVQQALTELSATQRQRIELHYFSGYTKREIAEMEGVSHQAICHSIKKSLRVLKKILRSR